VSAAEPVRVVILGGGFVGVHAHIELPGLDRKIRVALDWTLDLLLEKDLVQLRPERSGQSQPEPVG
jgi:NADH dehydrogenase FAD-containing subunit